MTALKKQQKSTRTHACSTHARTHAHTHTHTRTHTHTLKQQKQKMRRSRNKGGGQGVRTPLKNHKNIGFLSNICPDPLKNHKLPSQHSMLGHHRHASEMPFKWRVDDCPLIVAFHSSLLNQNNLTKDKLNYRLLHV